MKTFKTPTRVWINAQSSHNDLHHLNGKVGIAITTTNKLGKETTTIYFTEGAVLNMQINPLYLSSENSQNDILKFKI